MDRTQKHRDVAIGTPLGEDVLLLKSMSASEKLGRPFQYELDLISEDLQIKAADIVGQNVTVRIKLLSGEDRYFNGFISRFVQVPTESDEAAYHATAVPWLWFLTRTADCRIFQEMTVPDIIKQVFRDLGFTDFEDSLTATYRTWEYCVQYRETDFNFVSRLMEQEGIYYFFKHENGKHKLVMADSASAHAPNPGYEEIKYRPFSAEEDEEIISRWTTETRIQPGSYSLTDFDFKNTNKDLQARSAIPRDHEVADMAIFDYPGEYIESADGESYAKIRIEELHTQYEVATAASNAKGICPGYTFKLLECPIKEQNKEYMVTSANHQIDAGIFESGGGGDAGGYSCSFTAIDTAQPFRSLRITPKPSIPGPQTAVIVGPSGEEIYTDEHARVKVQFHWDRYGKADENSSCWIRVAQVWAGKKWGAMYIPRIGQEVIVEFLEGDPDHPIITGRVYNGTNTPPYELPGEKTKSTIKSNSSKGGGGFNEIRFEDKKDSEQIFINAAKDFHLRIENDRKEWVTNDRHLIVENDKTEHIKNERNEIVGKSHSEEIGEDRDLTVKGNEDKEVGKDLILTVKGNVTETFKMDHTEETTKNYTLKAMQVTIEAKTKIELKVGGSTISMNPGQIEIKAPQVSVNGSAMTEVKGGIVKIN